MEPTICPLTGGLIFVDLEKEQEKKDLIKKKHTKSLFPEFLKEMALNPNPQYNPRPSRLSLQDRFNLIRSVGEECIQENELMDLLKKQKHPICYDGFEPSGRMHIAQGILKAINVNRLVDAGCIFIFWVADWFGLLNNKMGGDLDKIKIVGQYFIEIWKAAGMKMTNVKFLWTSDEINKKANEYWLQVIDIARKNNIARIKRCATIMGRNEEDDMSVAQLLYPCMQCTDIFFLKADICQLGMDQRKVNMLAREYCDDIKKKNKPIILSHHMLMGLSEGELKMSKTNPASAVFMEDSEADIKKKLNSAFCPPKIVKDNPCLDYIKYIIFGANKSFEIIRKSENGGNKVYVSYEELENDYVEGNLHPGDLKPAIAKALNALVQPVREHFENDPRAKKILELVKQFQTTK